ncbi:Small subunit (SSU) processome component [Blyttiomyces sp. JEL0837]|nr:Small subunit (SSU) processome component [Blyttiomyces sp. JEL0837]
MDIPIKSIQDKKTKGNYKKTEKKFNEVAMKAAQSELLLPESAGYLEAEGMEKTFKFTQEQIKTAVDVNTEEKIFNLKLNDFGPYYVDYTRNGRFLLIGGKKGHIASFDWKTKSLGCEIHLKETVRDVKWLHNETMFAVAQKNYTYIYDKSGAEIHCLRKHIEVNRLEFLPYHFLLASIGKSGTLRYQDTSTGVLVAEHRTRLGDCGTMAQNPYNAIINLGHSNGTVTLWSPTVSTPLVKMLCHKGPVQALAVDRGGYYMVSSGLDGQMKVWDIRTYKCLHEYYTPTPASHLSISQLGLLAVGYGPHVTIWKDAFLQKAKSPYMSHIQPSSQISSLKFCPYDDVLGMGHSKGISSLVIPGSGEPNYDALEVNPFQTKKQRKTGEVKMLLDKLQPGMIALNPNFVGAVERETKEVLREEQRLEFEANNPEEKFEPRKRARGKSSSQRRYLRKQASVVDPNRVKLLERLQKEKEGKEKERKRARGEVEEEKGYSALDRFAKKAKV